MGLDCLDGEAEEERKELAKDEFGGRPFANDVTEKGNKRTRSIIEGGTTRRDKIRRGNKEREWV